MLLAIAVNSYYYCNQWHWRHSYLLPGSGTTPILIPTFLFTPAAILPVIQTFSHPERTLIKNVANYPAYEKYNFVYFSDASCFKACSH